MEFEIKFADDHEIKGGTRVEVYQDGALVKTVKAEVSPGVKNSPRWKRGQKSEKIGNISFTFELNEYL